MKRVNFTVCISALVPDSVDVDKLSLNIDLSTVSAYQEDVGFPALLDPVEFFNYSTESVELVNSD